MSKYLSCNIEHCWEFNELPRGRIGEYTYRKIIQAEKSYTYLVCRDSICKKENNIHRFKYLFGHYDIYKYIEID